MILTRPPPGRGSPTLPVQSINSFFVPSQLRLCGKQSPILGLRACAHGDGRGDDDDLVLRPTIVATAQPEFRDNDLGLIPLVAEGF